jgi:hypothetical protein
MAIEEQKLPESLEGKVIPVNNQVIYDIVMMSRSEFSAMYIKRYKLKISKAKRKTRKPNKFKQVSMLYDQVRDMVSTKTLTIDKSLRKSVDEG